MATEIRRVAINTGGGDAPGLNAVIHGAVYAARGLGWQIFGIRDGYDGFLEPQNYPDGGLIELRRSSVREISHTGGTILGTTNRGNPFSRPTRQPDGTTKVVDRSDELIEHFRSNNLDALIAVGGDGSLSIAHSCKRRACALSVCQRRSTTTLIPRLSPSALTPRFHLPLTVSTGSIAPR
jgi:ATP-dependent phosphofructokinase / diphosphate-dependent phosphofructokinase